MKRSRLHARVMGLSIAGVIALAGCSQPHGVATSAPPVQEEALPAVLAEAADQCGVRIEAPREPLPWYYGLAGFRVGPATAEQIKDYAPVLASELKRYPPDFFKRLRLERIILCGSLLDGKDDISGLAAPSNAICVKVAGEGVWEEDWQRHALHHELFHVLDSCNGHVDDAPWKALNRKGFHYGRASEQEMCGCAGRGGDGFLIAHGKSGVGEDQAHFFAFMMNHHAAVRDLGRRDPIVQAKTDLMEKLVADFFPALDAEFWAEAQRRSESVEKMTVASLHYGWAKVEPGVDPLAPTRQPGESLVIVRRTRFPGCSEWASGRGRLTLLGVHWRSLANSLYRDTTPHRATAEGSITFPYDVTAPRCLVPEELRNAKFDVIVSLPDVKENHDSRVWKAARAAFETRFGLTARKETREVDVYVIRLGARRTSLLDRASRRNRSDRPAPTIKVGNREEQVIGRVGAIAAGGKLRFGIENLPLSVGLNTLEQNGLDRPIVDETGYHESIRVTVPHGEHEIDTLRALAEALGLEIVSARRPVEMTVLEVSPTHSE